MAPAPRNTESKPVYAANEKVLCFHHDLLYDAKILEVQSVEKDGNTNWQYRVHYKGWKNTWDDLVPQDRLRKLNDENRELQNQLKMDYSNINEPRRAVTKAPAITRKPRGGQGSEMGSGRGSEDPHANAGSRKRNRDNEIEKEEQYRMRPMVRMPIPEILKGVLVDDWENVTKTLMLVKLPSERPVNWILDEYLSQKRKGMDLGSSDASILQEFVEGMKLYFKQALGRLLLYRFERDQYAEMGKKYWNKVGLHTVRRIDPVNKTETEEQNQVNVGDVYGAEHLCRLLVSLPELIAQTNMDAPSMARLREEVHNFSTWLAQHYNELFINQYQSATHEYVVNSTASGS